MVEQETLIDQLHRLGFSQYEAQCYLGLLRHHPLNGSQLSVMSGVPRSMVYQTLARLEEKTAVVRLHGTPGDPQQYEPVAPAQVIAQLAASFQATCERVAHDLDALATTPPAEVVVNIVGYEDILERAALLIRQTQQQLSIMAGAPELTQLEPLLLAATKRGVSLRMVSVGRSGSQGSAPAVEGQLAMFLGENVSAPTRFLLLIADGATALLATFPLDASATAVVTQNPILSRLFSAFLTTEYYLVRLSNVHPTLVGQLLGEVLEPEDRARYARILRFLDQQAATKGTTTGTTTPQDPACTQDAEKGTSP